MVFAFAATSVIWLVVPVGVAIICNRQATQKNRNPWVWTAVGFLAPLVGLIALAILRPVEEA
jgi:hypothetical protein